MKIWHCSYYWSGGYGAYQQYEYIVIADTNEEASQMVMKACEEENDYKTQRKDWIVTEIPMEKGTHYISEKGT